MTGNLFASADRLDSRGRLIRVGAMIGGYLAAWAPTDALRLVLAAILAASAVKLWAKSTTVTDQDDIQDPPPNPPQAAEDRPLQVWNSGARIELAFKLGPIVIRRSSLFPDGCCRTSRARTSDCRRVQLVRLSTARSGVNLLRFSNELAGSVRSMESREFCVTPGLLRVA